MDSRHLGARIMPVIRKKCLDREAEKDIFLSDVAAQNLECIINKNKNKTKKRNRIDLNYGVVLYW